MLDGRRSRSNALDRDAAEAIAVAALTFLADRPEQLSRFLSLSGLEPNQLRAASADPGFFVAILDFLLAEEALLLEFAQDQGLRAERVPVARSALAGRPADLDP